MSITESSMSTTAAAHDADLEQIWSWNRTVSETVARPVHEIFQDQLDRLSTKLAHHLQSHGVGPNVVVPLFFEKSMWTPVCQLAIMKAGGACAALDTTQTKEVLAAIIETISPIVVGCSPSNRQLVSDICGDCHVLVVDAYLVDGLSDALSSLATVHPSTMLYLIFTSGTTGKPKGVVISHANISSGLHYNNAEQGFHAKSRVLDFASCAFDVSYTNLLGSLTSGACLCIPSEQVRSSLALLDQYIAEQKINHADMTPSVVSAMPLSTLKNLDVLIVGGETLSIDQAKLWSSHVRLIQTYGPAECTITTTVVDIKGDEHLGYLGPAYGLNPWIIQDEDNAADGELTLAPVASIGELWLEGPLVGQGYLNDPGKTAEAFVQDPAFLTRGYPKLGIPGRRGRLYRTGDLVRYNSDGSLTFISRRDTQVKIRGQRVELSNVEDNARRYLQGLGLVDAQVVAEAITPLNSIRKILALFLRISRPTQPIILEGQAEERTRIWAAAATLESRLPESLPAYEVPSVYIPIDTVPATATGKADRRKLRSIFEVHTIRELAALSPLVSVSASQRRLPSSDTERALAFLWSQVLPVDESEIGLDDSFLRMGGDSLLAMKLVGLARERSALSFTSADLLKHPQLEQLAQVVKHRGVDDGELEEEAVVEPFSLLAPSSWHEQPISSAVELAARQCGLDKHQIQDIFPCTPLQEGLMALTARNPGDYVAHWVIDLCITTDTARLQRAWQSLVMFLPILRTRIVDLPHHGGLMQVIVDEQPSWTDTTSYAGFDTPPEDTSKSSLGSRKEEMGLGTPLLQYQLRSTMQGACLSVIIHHALYDGYSVPLLFELLEKAYADEGGQLPRGGQPPPFQSFVKFSVVGVDKEEAAAFWAAQLADSTALLFPSLPAPDYQVQVNQTLRQTVELEWPQLDATPSTIIWAAWAIVVAQFSSSKDVIFGVTLSGRQSHKATISRVGRMVGPTIATVPVRLMLDYSKTVAEIARAVQAKAVDLVRHEQTGLQNIKQYLPVDMKDAADFQSLIVVQPKADDYGNLPCRNLFKQTVNEIEDRDDMVGAFDTYALNLICSLQDGGVALELNYDDKVVDTLQAGRIMGQFKHVLEELCASRNNRLDGKPLNEIDLVHSADVRQLWAWNRNVPLASTRPIHDLITQTVCRNPDALAVYAWDGSLTYMELDLLSTRLARLLVAQAGVGSRAGMIVPLFFEKTLWMPVAMLAVMKAGGASVAIDINQPEKRQAAIIRTVRPDVVLASASAQSLAARIGDCRVIIADNANLHHDPPDAASIGLPVVDPSSLLYLIFTSGTTGKPKGVMVSHGNLSSAVHHQKHMYGYDSQARVFDFSSYAFDAAWLNFVVSSVSGACLCIPSDRDRQNDIVGSIARLKATHADITASVAKSLPIETIRSLRWLTLGGEAVRFEDAEQWAAENTTVINMYGPSECSPSATIATIEDMRCFPGSIGRGYGLNTWITDPDNFHSLLPIGCVGELLLEGPLVGPGYFHDPEKTNEAFIEDPGWLVRGDGPDFPGRAGRLYRTGDLVRYNPDGTLSFMGRADSQVKINGQRVEPSEIEGALRRAVPETLAIGIAVEMVKPLGSNKAMLIAFFDIGTGPTAGSDVTENDDKRQRKAALSQIVRETIAKQLPRYMIPSALLLIRRFPMTVTFKTDRWKLRRLAEAMTNNQIRALDPLREEPEDLSTDKEHIMAALWASVLEIPKAGIAANDSFLQLGGDSIMAMKLASHAFEHSLSFTVADVLRSPRLKELSAIAATTTLADQNPPIEPFSLMGPCFNQQQAIAIVAGLLETNASQIQDIFPCTPLQEGFLALSAKSSGNGDYVARYDLKLREDVEVGRFKRAWDDVLQQLPILRTRIVPLPGHGLVQVVVDERPTWIHGDAADRSGRSNLLMAEMGLCTPLMRFSLSRHDASSSFKEMTFTLCISHALYDGWSLPLVFESLVQAYRGSTPSSQFPPFQRFVKHVLNINQGKAQAFWTKQFDGLSAPIFPALNNMSSDSRIRPNRTIVKDLVVQWKKTKTDATASTMLLAGWSVVTMQYTNSPDVIFGLTLSGRQAVVPEIERIAGPTIATIPLRVRMANTEKVGQFVSALQAQVIDVGQYEQIGLQRIQKMSAEAHQACQFQSIVVVQPEEREQLGAGLFADASEPEDESADVGLFDSYALNLICSLRGDGVKLSLIYDDKILDQDRAEGLIGQLAHILQQLASYDNLERPLSELCTIQPSHLHKIWTWNAYVPETFREPVHGIFAEMVRKYPCRPAVDAWDGQLSYNELDWLSTRLAHKLVSMGVRRDVIVPLCFEKSKLSTICMLAVMKAGGASVTLDVVAQPEERLRTIVKTVSPIVALCSSAQQQLAHKICGRNVSILVISEDIVESIPENNGLLPEVDPDSILYIVFTSGTTGVPKGVTITHSNFSSAIRHQHVAMGRGIHSRVSDFASYAFDASWNNSLHTLSNGGCLCIPSDAARTGGLAEHIEEQRVNDIDITPSVAATLPFETLKKLKTMLVGGEGLSDDYATLWRGITTLKNVYGPAECTPTATIWDVGAQGMPPNCLGRGIGLNTWVVQGDDSESSRLAPIGSVGELWLEGPLVGRGYFGDADKTRAAFIHDPPWLLQGGGHDCPGRRGRLYRTGDLVYYNANGTLTFVSRKDEQVKIRGQRVELGDVEHHARQCLQKDCPGARIIVEAAQPRESKNSRLVVFLAADGSADRLAANADPGDLVDSNGDVNLVAKLEEQLPGLIPSYAVPSLYIHLHKIPLGPTGKVDRKRLRQIVSALGPEDLARFVPSRLPVRAPSTAVGFTLRKLWAESLDMSADDIGCDDNFMRLGGDSIKVMVLVREIKQTFSVNMGVDRFLQSKTLDSLGDEVVKLQQVDDTKHSFKADVAPILGDVRHLLKEVQVLQRGEASEKPARVLPRRVLLTGATGYLGTIILHKLLSSRAIERVFVLVRASSVEQARQRIIDTAVRAKWWDDKFLGRVSVWLGDLGKPRLGLDSSCWKALAGSIDSDDSEHIEGIVHNGAAVDWLGTYDSLRAVNVASTHELLGVARTSPSLSRLVYVSTSPDLDIEHEVCTEEDLRHELSITGGYGQSKMVAEYLLLRAVSHNIVSRDRICVVKPGFIIGDSPQGIANVDDYLWRIVAGSITIGSYPVESANAWIHMATCGSLASIAKENLFWPRPDLNKTPPTRTLWRALQPERFWKALTTAFASIFERSRPSSPLADHADERPLTRPVWSGLDPVRFWKAVNSALPVSLKEDSVTEWRNKMQARLTELGQDHPMFAVQGFLDDDDEAILGGQRTDESEDTSSQRMSQVEAAVVSNVKYLMEIGYFSRAGPSRSIFTRRTKV
ncbi:nonribosomal peptide synthase [Metarhizium rileyi]|uniref:Nonribosomal peptide synthase n=1 Tax=Metarhizium rileyi (strain RCEF 4871) TaxID=1649241 RepID=A0A166W175_METRR|nr:nonribosomal peptide synthase [Metarhizium rileyi RCEF 4871]